jgi:hypothetical protein
MNIPSYTSDTNATGRFIYVAYQESHLPWAYGGEYDQFSVFIRKIVQAWLGLGIHLSFVFDGNTFACVLLTLTDAIQQDPKKLSNSRPLYLAWHQRKFTIANSSFAPLVPPERHQDFLGRPASYHPWSILHAQRLC